MAAARASQRGRITRWSLVTAMFMWSVLALLPDADVIGFRLGIEYADPWGHRGASHSLTFALGVSLLVGLGARLLGVDAKRATVTALVVVASHGFLDTLTDGGLGCALWWPLSDARVFAPWRPIPVAPIGRNFFSSKGLSVAMAEVALFSPFLVYALWPRSRSGVTRAPDTSR
jgi:inner membrane protein